MLALQRSSGSLNVLRTVVGCRFSHSGSSKKWLDRQARDKYTQQAKNDEYRSRAAYKLQELNEKYRIFKPGQTVVDLGFAPGSWSQVAVEHTRPHGRVIGVDLLPVQPPQGVSAIQGNFLMPSVQEQLKILLAKSHRGRAVLEPVNENEGNAINGEIAANGEAAESQGADQNGKEASTSEESGKTVRKRNFRGADVVLSDMCGILPQESGFWLNSINTPYRLANTSGIVARDHASSIDLCDAALYFSLTQLRYGGTFVCKFYTGSEDKDLERRLKRVFKRVNRVKPDASRSESREAYFVARRKQKITDVDAVFAD